MIGGRKLARALSNDAVYRSECQRGENCRLTGRSRRQTFLLGGEPHVMVRCERCHLWTGHAVECACGKGTTPARGA